MRCPKKKQKYATRKQANKALRYQPRLKARGIAPYKCDDHWHLGSDPHLIIDKLLA